jgi:prevent-host-death family protein
MDHVRFKYGLNEPSGDEVGLDEARVQLTDLVDRAERAGDVTYLTRNGRRVAAVVPLDRIETPPDVAITLTSVAIIAEQTGASVEDVRDVIGRIKDHDDDELIEVSDDGELVSMDSNAAELLYAQLGQVVRFTRTNEQGEQDTVVFTVKGLDITETSTVNGTTRTRTDTGASMRDIDAYVNDRSFDLTAEGYVEEGASTSED